MKDIRQKAKELMRGACRLCPICDGRVCAGEVPGMGGLGSGTAFKNNVGSSGFSVGNPCQELAG